jgi:hypothetical protein
VFTGDANNGIPDGLYGLDLGPKTVAKVETLISESTNVIWYGSMGYEKGLKCFNAGSSGIVNALASKRKEHFSSSMEDEKSPSQIDGEDFKLYTCGAHANNMIEEA